MYAISIGLDGFGESVSQNLVTLGTLLRNDRFCRRAKPTFVTGCSCFY